MTRIPRWPAPAVAALTIPLLAACGGDDDSDDAAAEEPAETTTTSESETTTTTAEQVAGDGAGAGAQPTPPGTELAFGEAATVPLDPADPSAGMISVTVDGVDPGTPEDLASLQLQGGETGDLYYVNMTIANASAAADAGSYTPDGVIALQDDGEQATPVVEFGVFPPCENDDPSELAVGESFNRCEIYLAQTGVPVSSVEYNGDFSSEPIVWG